jgi:hypothetical protein
MCHATDTTVFWLCHPESGIQKLVVDLFPLNARSKTNKWAAGTRGKRQLLLTEASCALIRRLVQVPEHEI